MDILEHMAKDRRLPDLVMRHDKKPSIGGNVDFSMVVNYLIDIPGR